ncbi:uncharacterized protein LOC100166739 [Acyrthosiphon pisum]|uniref:Uncharacterized protein n=1 Tax=Acyrthosiphon pisum TaxID=7029 RepID=A0A8R1VYR8_ACYPI|nr:uncharacterized protein LOC100166739 [Acyrthosiphon pisum]|eukprot:XP_001943513.2 PREDICTED: uncharacterized protein LOC100166739 [Acyrthosiphon pisum]
MNIFTVLYLLPYVLLLPQIATTAVVIGQEAENDVQNLLLENDLKTNESDGSTAIDQKSTSNNETPPKTLNTVFKIMSKGNELKNQYGFVIPKLASMMLKGGLSMNPFRLISFLPYIMLALQKANAPPVVDQSSNQIVELNHTDLASVLEYPELFRKIFSKDGSSKLAVDSLKLLAGQEASADIDKLIDDIETHATDIKDGKIGINGQRLVDILENSETFKKLFQTDQLTIKSLNYMNAYMDSYLSTDVKDIKNEVLNEMRDIKNIRQKNQDISNNSVKEMVRGTFSDGVTAFFKIGQKKINEKLQSLSSDADKNFADWKRMSAPSTGNNDSPTSGGLKNTIINNSPDVVLKLFATGSVIKDRYGHLIPQLASYFLPVGLSMDALKFMCLVTYVMLIVKKENMIPEMRKDNISVPGLNTERIIDILNNNEMMAKIFPLDNHSNVRVEMLKFLGGQEVNVIDNLVAELKKMKSAKGGDPTQNKLTIFDVLQNIELFKKLFAMKEYADVKMKSYFGVDFSQLKNEIVDEMNKNNNDQETSIFSSVVPKSVSNALMAVYKVGVRKANDQMGSVNVDIQKQADQMTKAPGPSETESTASGLFRKAINMAPKPVLYGLAGGKVVANRFSSFFRKTNSDAPANSEVAVAPNN